MSITAIVLSGVGSRGGTSTPAAPPGDVVLGAVTGFIDPNSGAITLTIPATPPGPIGTFIGCHIYFEGPDQSSTLAAVVGVSAIGDGSTVAGAWVTLDAGREVYVASQQPWTVTFPGPPDLDPTVDTPCRVYAVSFSTGAEKTLIQAGQPGASPNATFTLVSLASGSPTSGTSVTTLTGGNGSLIGLVVTPLAPVNVDGKLKTPFMALLTDSPPSTPGWTARLVLVLSGQDPTNVANQQVVADSITQAGPVYQTGDGLNVPHSFALDTPTAFTRATVYLQAGLIDASGNAQWNNIVPGITPSFPVTYGSTTGTIDASSVITATITAAMGVVNGLFGVVAAGITNPLLGAGAVATINVQNLAITNPLLASLVVDAAKLASGAVDSTKIAALAVGTGAIQTAAITNALIANLAVSGAQIQSATITGANIASATIAGANIGTATIAQANIANLAVGTAQIQNLAITDAKVNDLSVAKLTAGTANFTGDVTFSRSGSSSSVTIAASGITLFSGSFGTGVTISSSGTVTFASGGSGTSITGNSLATGTINATTVIVGPGVYQIQSGLSFLSGVSGSVTVALAGGGSATLVFTGGIRTS